MNASQNRRRKERIVKRAKYAGYEIIHRVSALSFTIREVRSIAKDAGIDLSDSQRLLSFARHFARRWHEFETFAFAA